MNRPDSIPASSDPEALRATMDPRDEIERLREALAASEARERSLAFELQHRVRNMLAVIRSIHRRSREGGASQEEFAEHFEGRLDAVSRYQSHVDGVGSSGMDLEDMLRDELFETRRLDGPKCRIGGPPVRLRRKAAELMGLAIHELTTNAIKFGAVAQGGTITVEWSLEGGSEGALLCWRWAESGVSVTTPAPRPSGFGRKLIEEALPYELGATTSFDLKPGGVECSILLPLGPDAASNHRQERAGEEPSLLPSEAERGR